METLTNNLIKNIKTLLSSAELVYKTGDYTSATVLYFKAAFAVLDLIILRSKGKTPKDHGERFRILQESFQDLYDFLDKFFVIYQRTYTLTIDKESCNQVRENVEKIIKKYEVPV